MYRGDGSLSYAAPMLCLPINVVTSTNEPFVTRVACRTVVTYAMPPLSVVVTPDVSFSLSRECGMQNLSCVGDILTLLPLCRDDFAQVVWSQQISNPVHGWFPVFVGRFFALPNATHAWILVGDSHDVEAERMRGDAGDCAFQWFDFSPIGEDVCRHVGAVRKVPAAFFRVHGVGGIKRDGAGKGKISKRCHLAEVITRVTYERCQGGSTR